MTNFRDTIDMKHLYQELCRARFFQEKLLSTGTPCYTEFGEEAISVGSVYGMRPDDIVSCYFRGEGSVIRMKGGVTINDQMACWKGRMPESGIISATLPSAWTDVENGVIGTTSSLIGADADIAVGVAMAQKMQNTGKAVLFLAGDGACSKGNFHEMFNFASLYKLPLVVMVRGNGWAMSTNVERNTHVSNIPAMAEPFGFKTKTVDGNNVLEIAEAVREAAEYAATTGPYLIEAKTYRVSGHSPNDEDDYRDPSIKAEWQKKDPLLNLEKEMLLAGVSPEEINATRLAIIQEVDQAYEWSQGRPVLKVEEYYNRQTRIINKMWGDLA